MKSKKLFQVPVLLLLILFLPVHYAFSARYYVVSDGSGSGSSWADALGDIQSAIDGAALGDEVWVKTGTYKPSLSDRLVAISLKSGVKLYGGFQGNEASIEERALNDNDANGITEPWEFLYPTILSGEIQDDGTETNNSNQIITIPSGVDVSTLIDGFTITSGYCDTKVSTTQGLKYFASGILALGGGVTNCEVVDCKNVSDEGYGGGVYVYDSELTKCFISNCKNDANISFGGGVYAQNSKLDSCVVSSCSVISGTNNKAWGGGMYCNTSEVMECLVFNCSTAGNQGLGGGIYGINSAVVNTVVNNNEAIAYGGGIYNLASLVVNCNIVNNKVTGTAAIGGGGYGNDEAVFYNTVFWGNQTSGTSAQLRLDTGGKANSCAAENEDLTGTNNINISSDNTGSETSALYPKFVLPTTFVGITGGETSKEDNLALANWDIEKSSSLIEKGDNEAFNESLASINSDLNGDGDKFDGIDSFYDLAGELRLFNLKADIGAYESRFVDLILPSNQNVVYGVKLGDITIIDGGAIDNRDGSNISGTYAFTDVDVVPIYSSENAKYRVSFTPDDLTKYPVSYDSITVVVTAKALTLSGLTSDNKVYDGNTVATFSGTPVLEGIVTNDDVSLDVGTIVATFSDKDVATNKTVSYSGYTLVGADKNNYSLTIPTSVSDITKRTLAVSVLTANDKVYDGTTAATYTETPTLINVVSGDDVSLDLTNQLAVFESKIVDINKTVTYSGFALAGADKNNYNLNQPVSSEADITPLDVVVSGVDVEDKIYDGTTSAVITGTAIVNGLIATDDVTLRTTSASASFNDKNVGLDKPISFSGYILLGADGMNYNLSLPSSVTASISGKELTITGLSVANKDYDGTTNGSFSGTPVLSGVINNEDVSLDMTNANVEFIDKNAGAEKQVTIGTIGLNGADKGNYSLIQPEVTATIYPIDISIAAEAKSKIYGESDPELTYTITSGTLISGDSFTGALKRDVGEDVNTYSISNDNLSAGDNYSMTFTSNTFTIYKASNIIDFSLESPIIFELDKQINMGATSSSGLDVVFESSDETIAAISGNTLTIKSYGSIQITAQQAGNNNYEEAVSVIIDLEIELDVEALRKGDNMVLVNNIQEQFSGYQWYRNNQSISGANKQYYYASEGLTGDYYCMVTTQKGDEFQSNIIATTSTKSMQVYPSPAVAGGNIKVELNGFDNSDSVDRVIKVYSITGDLVQTLTQVADINTLNIQKPGIYIIKTEGGSNLTQKIIVK